MTQYCQIHAFVTEMLQTVAFTGWTCSKTKCKQSELSLSQVIDGSEYESS